MPHIVPIMGEAVNPFCAHLGSCTSGPILGTFPPMQNNLKALRNKRGWSQDEAAERMGTTRNQYAKLEGGSRRLSDVWIARAAQAFGVDAGELVTSKRELVPLVGYVGAGSLAHYFGEGDGERDQVEAPENATEQTVGVEVRGDSLGAVFDRWVAYYDDVRLEPTPDMIGKLCIVGLHDGRVLIKKLEKGQLPKHYNLISQDPPIYDAEVVWAAVVKAMMPRG